MHHTMDSMMRPPIMITAITGHLFEGGGAVSTRDNHKEMGQKIQGGMDLLAIHSLHTIAPTGKGCLDIRDVVFGVGNDIPLYKSVLQTPR